MDLLNELARTDIDPALLAQVQALFAQQQAKLAEKDFKITTLTHELACYRRIRSRAVDPTWRDGRWRCRSTISIAEVQPLRLLGVGE